MAGRPRKTFTDQQVEQIKSLARCHCPDSEIAAYMGVGENTIQRHFGALLKEQREVGKSNIRAKQFRMALEGDKTMLIWVGKQILGQRDQHHNVIVDETSKLSDEELTSRAEKLIAEIKKKAKRES